jgi:hypothetical protein
MPVRNREGFDKTRAETAQGAEETVFPRIRIMLDGVHLCSGGDAVGGVEKAVLLEDLVSRWIFRGRSFGFCLFMT